MTQVAEQLKQSLLELSTQERAELAQILIHSLDEHEDPEAEEAWDRELEKRVEEVRSGQVVGEPADQVFARLREKYG